MKGKKRLFTPGPTAVPAEVLAELARPLVHHRTDSFREFHRGLVRDLQTVFGTVDPVVILTASGTGAMEAAVANITMPGETVLITPCGKFGERWGELARTYGLACVRADAEWGTAVSPEAVEAALEAHPAISTVFATHVETSTGVRMDVEAMARIAHDHGAIIVVDAITGLCAETVKTDEWGLDAVIGGAQKGFGAPPGVSFISLGTRARERVRRTGHPVYYFNLARALDSLEKGDTAYTPAIPLFHALGKSLQLILAEGVESVVNRHGENARAVRCAVEALELTLFSHSPCNATTPVVPPAGTARSIIARMDDEYGVRIAGGQGPLKGKIFRLGHLGFYNRGDILEMITALENALRDCGISTPSAAGHDAAVQSYERHGK